MAKQKIKFNILGIKFTFTPPPQRKKQVINSHGQNNKIDIFKYANAKVNIEGNNNTVIISGTPPTGEPLDFEIKIKGDNNTVIINKVRTARLLIDIGNFIGVNNVNISIDENFVCNQAGILAYQHNTPVTIGKNCLFSSGITLRTGELPHKIFDKNTKKDLDFSDGIKIGNHVWICTNCFILKHAKIPNNSIAGCASVVTKEFNEENIVIAGNPAKICKKDIHWSEQ